MQALLLSFLLLCGVVSTGFAASGASSDSRQAEGTALPYSRNEITTGTFSFSDKDRFAATVLNEDFFRYFIYLRKNGLRSAFDMCLQLAQEDPLPQRNRQVISKMLNLPVFQEATDIEAEYPADLNAMKAAFVERQRLLLDLCDKVAGEDGVARAREQISQWPLDELSQYVDNRTLSAYVELMLLPIKKNNRGGVGSFFSLSIRHPEGFYFKSNEIAQWAHDNLASTEQALDVVREQTEALIKRGFPAWNSQVFESLNLGVIPDSVWPARLLSDRAIIISNDHAISDWPWSKASENITKLKELFRGHDHKAIKSFFELLNYKLASSDGSLTYDSYLCKVLTHNLVKCASSLATDSLAFIQDQVLAEFMFNPRAEGFMKSFLSEWHFNNKPFQSFLFAYATTHGLATSRMVQAVAERSKQILCGGIVDSFGKTIVSPYFFQQQILMLKKFLPGDQALQFLGSLTAQDFSRNNFIKKFRAFVLEKGLTRTTTADEADEADKLADELGITATLSQEKGPYVFGGYGLIEDQVSQARFLLTVDRVFGEDDSPADQKGFLNFCIGDEGHMGFRISQIMKVVSEIWNEETTLSDSMKAFLKAFLEREEVSNASDIKIGEEIGIDLLATNKLYKTLQARKLLYEKLCNTSGLSLMDIPELTSPAQAQQKTLEDFMEHYNADLALTKASAFIKFNNAMLRMASFTSEAVSEKINFDNGIVLDSRTIEPQIQAAINVVVDRLRMTGEYQNLALIASKFEGYYLKSWVIHDEIALKYKDLTLDKLDGDFLKTYPEALKDLSLMMDGGDKPVCYVKLKRLIQNVASSHERPSDKFIAFLSIQNPALTELFSDALLVDASTLEDSITIQFASSVLSKMPSDSKLSESLTAAGFDIPSSSIINKPDASGSGASDPAVDNLSKHPSASIVAGVAGVSGLILSVVITHLLLQPELKKQRELRNQLVEAGKNTEYIDKKIARLESRNKRLTAALGILGGAVGGTAGYMIARND